MEKRINDLSKASGTGAIPIASAETLGGIKVPADSGITITGSGNAYAYKPANYSITEHKTGRKWIDGSDIYEKSVVLENTAIEKDTAFNICDATGIEKVFSGEFYSTGEGGGNNLATWINDGYVKAKSCATYSSGTVTVTITYTKTE